MNSVPLSITIRTGNPRSAEVRPMVFPFDRNLTIEDVPKTRYARCRAISRVSTRVTTMGEVADPLAHEVNRPIAGVLINAQRLPSKLAPITPISMRRAAVTRIPRDDNVPPMLSARLISQFERPARIGRFFT